MAARRPAFDPSRTRAAATPPAASDTGTVTVSELNGLIRGALTRHLPSTLHVVGELSNVSQPASGHLYFTLKDDRSEIRAVMWRSDLVRVKFEPRDGLEVIATGGVDVYEPRGQYQLYARRLEPRGVGALELAFRQLREKLEREGLFDPARKRPLPRWPRRIAVVTSATGAAIRDILKVLRRRFPCLQVLVYPVRVQGEGAAEEIAAAIATLNARADRLGGLDVMIVGRGGGSLEDLWAFNEEVVARAIVASRIPIVSAVGHEVDVTISDLVADVRAPTPSAAAEIVVPVLDEVVAMLANRARLLHRHARHQLEVAAYRLDAVARHEWFRDPAAMLARREQTIDEIAARLSHATTRRLDALRRELHRCETTLARIRPDAYIQRQHRRLANAIHRLRWALRETNQRAERRLAVLADRLHAATPAAHIGRGRLRLDHMQQRLAHGTLQHVEIVKQRIDGLAARLDSVGYRQVLSRGYTITRSACGRRIVTAADQVQPGDRVVTETHDGEFESRVLDTQQPELFE